MTLADLRERWESRRSELERLGALVDGAKLAGEVLADLERLAQLESTDSVTLSEAARLGGYSVDRLQHLVASGQIENVGRRHRPRIRRRDVPLKAGYIALPATEAGPQFSDRRRIAASVITGDHT